MPNNRHQNKGKPKSQVFASTLKRTASRGSAPKDPSSSIPSTAHYEQCHIKFQCRSCEYVNDPYQAKLAAKHQQGLDLLRSAGLLAQTHCLPPVAAPRPLAYRNIAKLVIRAGATPNELPSIGLYKPGSHEVVDIGDCPLHLPAINKFLRSFKKELHASGIVAWDEASQSGSLRYVIIRASHLTQELLVTFVSADAGIKTELTQIVKALKPLHKIAGAHLNLNQSPGNHIFGETTQKLFGSQNLRESLCDLQFAISPQSFFQINPWQAENIYRRLEQIVGNPSRPDTVAWDLYSGIAPISMVLARSGFRVLAIEENPDAVADAEVNCKLNKLEDKVTFMTGRVEQQDQFPAWSQHPQLVVANPSRKGIAPESRERLKKLAQTSSVFQFLYVSCDLETFVRDLQDLESAGLKLRQIEAFDMFAQTAKLEWLAVMTV